MKILITNHDLYCRGGSQLFTADLAFYLTARGHDVSVFAPIPGLIGQEMQQKGIHVFDDLSAIKDEKFDIIHAQHNIAAIMARSVFVDTPMVMMVHGVLPELEQPPSINVGISHFIAVSEEVKEHLQKQYHIPASHSSIVRNFVDLERFYCQKPVSQILKKILVISNHYTEDVRKVVEGAAAMVGVRVEHIGMPDRSVSDTETYINDSDLVISLGRGALQAMACERNVIVYDMHGADGMIDEENFSILQKNNFSGRVFKKRYTIDDLKGELNKYDPKRGLRLRSLVEEGYNADTIILDLERVYNNVLSEEVRPESKIQKGEMYREMSLLVRWAKEFLEKDAFIQEQTKYVQQLEGIVKKQEDDISALSRKIRELEDSVSK